MLLQRGICVHHRHLSEAARTNRARSKQASRRDQCGIPELVCSELVCSELACLAPVVDRALELAEQVEDRAICERQDLSHDQAGYPLRGIEPVVGIGEAGPGEAAGPGRWERPRW